MTWHVPGDLLDRYLSGRLDPAQVISVEAHLANCAPCRTAVPCDREWLAANRAAIAEIIDRPELTLLERALIRAGVPDHLARLLAATPTLSRSWLAAVVSALVLAVGVTWLWSGHPESRLLFLVVVPVLPLGGIALAYGRRVDPAYELVAATPTAGPRLLLIRACSVLVTAVALAGAATPLIDGMTAVWLLPALALAVGCLTLSRHLETPVAAAVLAGAWIGAVITFGGLTGDPFTPFHPPAQVLYGVAVAVLGLIMLVRLHRLDPGVTR